jgi:type II secretory pathway pseudopilin PulG
MSTLPVNRRSEQGLTIIEVMISCMVLAIALVGLVSGLLSSMRLRELNNEKAIARNAAEQAISAIRGIPTITEAYARFGGSGPEESFDVYGLPGPGGGEAVGRVIVWRLKSGNPPDPASPLTLSAEDRLAAQTRLGMAFPLPLIGNEGPGASDFLDTNGDGLVNGSDNPSLMPVTVRVRWRSRSGIVTEYFSTVIGLR